MADSQKGFSFSHEITSLSQSAETNDCSWRSFSQNDYREQLPPPRQSEPISRKYNIPAWTRGILKTSDDYERLKSHEHVVKRANEDSAYIRRNVEELKHSQTNLKSSVGTMITEAMNYMQQNLQKSMESFKEDIFKAVDEVKLDLSKQEELFAELFVDLKEIRSMLKDTNRQDRHLGTLTALHLEVKSIKSELVEIKKRQEDKRQIPVQSSNGCPPTTQPTCSSTPKKHSLPPVMIRRKKRRLLMPELTMDDFEPVEE